MEFPTPAQLEAVVTAMCLVGYSDGELTGDELAQLGQLLDATGWCEPMTDAAITELLERGADRAAAIQALPDDGSWDDAITLLAAELDSLEMRRAAYAMAAAVAVVDGRPTAEEITTLDMLAVACGLDPAQPLAV